ncbi:DNA-binding protein [Ureibacillus massiliensis 4400831 = CIP 108448 = CCUG 49529]|uniref:DNA-binding protein n=1 Tax=Ureibacillus massiliensis 4400831 = CIP 108448 = CCUG 49529 TaxID=1211035 RepID=A0A0A3IYV7_9BACL|nr:Mu transposase C-terminal domain-containing protein [Ureibacillus massiliensis]KGR89866.1 DNA-binding protein [Ureibacillus massiliensis 4400831 = CIP 108448 = CCUG 49529]
MLLTVNTLIGYTGDSLKDTVERILWISSDYTVAVLIDIYANKSTPIYKNVEDIVNDIEIKGATVIKDDPFQIFRNDNEINEKEKEIRNKAWEIIKAIAEKENEPEVFNAKKRAELVKKASGKFGVSNKTVYKYLRRYWQRGKHMNALLPDYKNIGRSQEKQATGKKRGRPKKYKDIVGEGVNVNEETKRIFRIALNKFYYTKSGNSLNTAYQLMRKEFYADGYRIDGGIRKPILKPSSEVPTFGQFKYFFYKERNLKKEIYSRQGSKEYLQNHRALLGNSTVEAYGPGYYEIDATIADVYLVSRYNRNWIIGRPVIYLCVDKFSMMITGLYVGLEGPSWNGAMSALANSASNKVDFCKEYDIEIIEEQWPSRHLCDTLIADRELQGKMVETLVSSLHVKVQNTSPYRADMKPFVERKFQIINEKSVQPFLPGTVKTDFRKRGSRDYRLDSVLDLFQFTQVMIYSILEYNQSWLSNYNREEMMISDDIEPIPIKLWNWGMKNRAGLLRSVSEDTMKLCLMPTANAYITGKGIKFKGLFYTSSNLIREGSFERVRISGSGEKIHISYDPRNLNFIYIKKEDGKEFEKCHLLDYQEVHINKSIEEFEYLQEYEKLLKKQKEDEQLQSKIDLISEIENIVQEAEKMTREQQDETESKTQKLKGIRKNRQIEKMINKENEAFELDKKVTNEKGEVLSFNRMNNQEPEEGPEEFENEMALLRKKQKERTYGKTE